MNETKKIAEAEYFLAQMQKEENNRDAFTFNLSAFLSAARSVLQYASNEAESKPSGKKWYETFMANSPILRFFRGKRNINIHVEPVEIALSVNVTVHDTIHFSESVLVVKRDKDGNVVDQISTGPIEPAPAPPAPEATIQYRYTFPDWQGNEDVKTLAQAYLNELKALVQDGTAKGFLSV